ncbi:MAG: hypothetical protein EA367_12750 [Leptolyngbya sp. DLM2.Bin15]|nr:MAG: hypothetical protein EA367_12750 [Leptolyngbya sp. DLM2.Bin15]
MTGGAIAPHAIAIISTHSTRYNQPDTIKQGQLVMPHDASRCVKGDRRFSFPSLTIHPLDTLAFPETRLDRHA